MTRFLFTTAITLANLTMMSSAMAGSVELEGGGQCEGDITARDLNGEVSCDFGNGDRFEGTFVDGKKEGQGIYTFAEGGKYEGNFDNDAISGKGVRINPNG
ncbi:MAG: hypothetical protein AAFN00_15560, partial [Cyanobacteria bacterium J06558_2]